MEKGGGGSWARGRARERALSGPKQLESTFVDKLAEKEATKIPTKEEVSQIQKMIMDDISDDSDASLDKNDERLLAESRSSGHKKIIKKY